MSELTEIATWEDPDENDGQWPYPTRYTKSEITGELADRCRLALSDDIALDATLPVYITERVESGGYSEYTQEDWTDFVIECGNARMTFDQSGWNDSTFTQLLKWLDAKS